MITSVIYSVNFIPVYLCYLVTLESQFYSYGFGAFPQYLTDNPLSISRITSLNLRIPLSRLYTFSYHSWIFSQDMFITILLVHSISECVTGILGQVTTRDSIHNSVIIDTLMPPWIIRDISHKNYIPISIWRSRSYQPQSKCLRLIPPQTQSFTVSHIKTCFRQNGETSSLHIKLIQYGYG